jgi:hypothetical protein
MKFQNPFNYQQEFDSRPINKLVVLQKSAIIIIFFIVSVAFYMAYEKWSFVSSLFFVMQTITTVGTKIPSN